MTVFTRVSMALVVMQMRHIVMLWGHDLLVLYRTILEDRLICIVTDRLQK